ncbi:MAG: hypothetical protein EOO07_29295, partial [Chitinophagaceae bacterium]
DKLNANTNVDETWLLFLPENENHELGILFAKYLLRKAGKKIIYLGANVPTASVAEVVKSTKIDCLLLFMVQTKLDEHLQEYLANLNQEYSHLPIYIAGNAQLFNGVSVPQNVVHLANIKQFQNIINPNINVH